MPVPYSYDLRTKVLSALDEGMKKTQASRTFKISRNTINLWIQRREETGDYRAKTSYQKGYDAKITDLDSFREFAKKNESLTQKEMAEIWEGEMSDRTIGKALKKINFTRKKKRTGTKKEMKGKEESS